MPNKVGLIPAHAGKTRRTVRRGASAWAHPRSRGENQPVVQPGRLSRGSSPLTRGKRALSEGRPQCAGLIPAHAGKTPRRAWSWGRTGAHPRSRGENGMMMVRRERGRGSSPLTRGKRGDHEGDQAQRRLIPAHAGKTPSVDVAVSFSGAHPRSRGENTEADEDSRALWGSSPLTRGKPHRDRVQRHEGGLIPAHAGKTRPMSWKQISSGAHPRSRGENFSRRRQGQRCRGSSPLTRGKRADAEVNPWRLGLIPAHAGKTAKVRDGEVCARAHPRSRGENSATNSLATFIAGSSPLTRGKHVSPHVVRD